MNQIPLIIEPDPDEPQWAAVMVDGTVAGRSYRFMLDTGAARSQIGADDYTDALACVAQESSSGAIAAGSSQVVTISDLRIGPMRAASLDVTRAGRSHPGTANLIGMDVLGRYCCHFRFDAGVLVVQPPQGQRPEHDTQADSGGHVYVDVSWPGVSGHACWDSGAGPTVVDQGFWLAHPELFEQVGMSTGTDSTGAQVQTPTLLMAESVIAGRRFGGHKVVAVDLSHINSTAEQPMDLILGYPALRQADWLFDFPAGRWTLTSGPAADG